MTEAELYATEVQILGREHADEHAEERADERRQQRHWRALTPAAETGGPAGAEGFAAARPDYRGTSARGRDRALDEGPVQAAKYAIHSVMLPTGKLLFWGFPSGNFSGPNVGNANIWDPSKGYGRRLHEREPPVIDRMDRAAAAGRRADLLLRPVAARQRQGPVTGEISTFPTSPPARSTRTGPASTSLHLRSVVAEVDRAARDDDVVGIPPRRCSRTVDGRARRLRLGRAGRPAETALEIFTPGGGFDSIGSFELNPEASRPTSCIRTCPRCRTATFCWPAPDDPIQRSSTSAIRRSGDWTTCRAQRVSARQLGRAGSRIAEGLLEGDPDRRTRLRRPAGRDATRDRHDRDDRRPAPGEGWKVGKLLNIPAQPEQVLLPDDRWSRSGGGIGSTVKDGVYAIDSDGARRQIELFDPETGTWPLGPAQMEDRRYHSTAVLLPDGARLLRQRQRLSLRVRRLPQPHRQRRDLLTAVPVQGHAAGDQEGRQEDRLERADEDRDEAQVGRHGAVLNAPAATSTPTT